MRESLLLAAVYITLASNLNLMIGYAGYVNFGNIVFFGLGGYFCIYLVTVLALAAPSRRRLSAASRSARWRMLFGLGILRLRGAFFALATIGVNEAVQQLRHELRALRRRDRNLSFARCLPPLGGPMHALWTVYFLIVARDVASMLLSYVIKRSKFGLGLIAIGQNEDAADVLGVNTRATRLWSTASRPFCRRSPAACTSSRAASSSRAAPSIWRPRSRRS